MANQEQLAILKQGVDAWNRWRKGNKGVTVDLSSADMSGTNLSYANLSEANFSLAVLIRTNLKGAGITF